MDLTQVRFEGRPTLRVRPLPGPFQRPPPRPSPARAEAAAPAPRADGLPALVLARAGLDAAVYRARPLERRVPACLRALKADGEPDARARLAERPELLARALSAVLIGVSEFFRDGPVFDALRARVVPALATRGRPLRVLSIGCSTGAEPYSVAILLAEAGRLAGAEIVGLDCRADALAAARTGVYAARELAGLDPALRARYFAPARGGWRIAPPLRNAVAWQHADATRALPAGPWDLVLCRNLFIYLQPSVVTALLERIHAALAPGGFLVVGKAERPPARLPLSPVGRCVYGVHDG